MSLGGTTANRYDVPLTGAATTATYLKQLGNLYLDFATDEVAVFVQDSWRVSPRLTVNGGLRWEGGFNPTPEANNDFMVNALKGVTFPLGRTVDPTQIPDQTEPVGAARSASHGTSPATDARWCAATAASTTRARPGCC